MSGRPELRPRPGPDTEVNGCTIQPRCGIISVTLMKVRRREMKRERESITYSRLVTHLLALREEVLPTSREEARALDRIISDLVSLEVFDRNTAGESSAAVAG